MNPIIILIAVCISFLMLVITAIWPTVGLLGYMGIYFFKIYLRVFIPALMGFWGYILDTGLLLIALIGFTSYSLRVPVQSRKFVPHCVWLIFIFLIGWTWFRYPVSRVPELAWSKSLIFSIFCLLTMVLGIVWGRSEYETGKIVKSLVLMGIVSFFGVVLFGRAHGEAMGARLTVGYANPLVPADFASYFLLVAVVYWISRRTFVYTVLAAACLPAAVGTIVLTGTRGPFVVLPLLVIIIFYFYRREVNFKLIVYLSLLAIVVCAAIIAMSEMEIVQRRFDVHGIREGFDLRVWMSQSTIESWLHSPFLGRGPGDTHYQFNYEFPHPHNILLELLNELGLIGFIPFSILIYLGMRAFKYLSTDYFDGTVVKDHSVIIFICFFYSLVMSFKTNTYAGSNMFYFFLGALISQAEYLRQLSSPYVLEQEPVLYDHTMQTEVLR